MRPFTYSWRISELRSLSRYSSAVIQPSDFATALIRWLRNLPIASGGWSDDGRSGHEAMADVVHNHAEAFDGPHAQEGHVARFGENDFIVRFIALRAQDRIADRTPQQLLV